MTYRKDRLSNDRSTGRLGRRRGGGSSVAHVSRTRASCTSKFRDRATRSMTRELGN